MMRHNSTALNWRNTYRVSTLRRCAIPASLLVSMILWGVCRSASASRSDSEMYSIRLERRAESRECGGQGTVSSTKFVIYRYIGRH